MQDCSGVSRHPQMQSHNRDSFPLHTRPAIPVDSAPGLTPPKCQSASGHTHWAPMWHSILVSHPLRSREGNILEHGVARIPKNHRSSPMRLSDVLTAEWAKFRRGKQERQDFRVKTNAIRRNLRWSQSRVSRRCCSSFRVMGVLLQYQPTHFPTYSDVALSPLLPTGVIIQGSGR